MFASIVALRQKRLKLLIAYSTLAQIGYLFLMFPLAFGADSGQLEHGAALAGGSDRSQSRDRVRNQFVARREEHLLRWQALPAELILK